MTCRIHGDPSSMAECPYCVRNEADRLHADNARLRKALDYLVEYAELSNDCHYEALGTSFVLDVARAALAAPKEGER